MTEQVMRGLLQARLKTLGWADQTAWEGRAFTPTPGTPYQEITTQFFDALPIGLVGSDMVRGLFQVRLLYPLTTPDGTGVTQVGIGPAWARAAEIQALFPRNLVLSNIGGRVKIAARPTINRGPVQGDRDVTVVRIAFRDR